MDIKLKNYKYSAWLKLLAILLCIAGVLTTGYGLLRAPYFEYAFQNKNFKESSSIRNILYDTYSPVSTIALKYKNEEYIKSGEALDKDQIYNRKSDLLNQKASAISDVENRYNQSIEQYKYDAETYGNDNTENSNSEKNVYQERILLAELQKQNQLNQINQKYDELIKNIETQYINEQLLDYHRQSKALQNDAGIYYTVTEADKVLFSNLPAGSSEKDFFNQLPFSTKLTTENNISYFANNENSYYIYYSSNEMPENTIIYLGMSTERYQKELSTFNKNMKEGLNGVVVASIGLLGFLVGLIYLIYSAGRRTDKDGIHLIAIDTVYIDIMLAISTGLVVLCMSPVFEYGKYLFSSSPFLNKDLLLLVFSISLTVSTLIVVNLIVMLTKRLKRHELIKYTLTYKVLYWIINKLQRVINAVTSKISSVYDRSPLAIRLVLIFGAYALSIFISILLFLAGPVGVLMGFSGLIGVNVLAGYLVLKTFQNIKDIGSGADRIRAGELSYIIPETGHPELRKLAMTINRIADGFKNAVSSQVKAERMKTELITNVSHDLKTPLTSIITYVDLLKNEGLQSENALKYIGIIDTKSQRLKTLTEDLFEAAKATSGNISVSIDQLDIVSLINQGLGELSDKITASGLNFKINLPPEKLLVKADGKLLWRVIENLLSNVFKYALPNSRVYIDAATQGEHVYITIKNISAYELNICEDELMERFKRGDTSRHSEGSGLGLSIAKSLTELQGGTFRIEIDGDLFKATVELQKA